MTNDQGENLKRDLRDYGWERVQGKLKAPAKLQLQELVDAWLEGRVSMDDAAAAVRAVVPVDPATLPLDPRSARVVDGRLFRRSGKRWLASDGSALEAD